MLKKIWQWITRNVLTRFHDHYGDCTPEQLQQIISDNLNYADEEYARAQAQWNEAEDERVEYLANIKDQENMLSNEYPHNFNYVEGRPNDDVRKEFN